VTLRLVTSMTLNLGLDGGAAKIKIKFYSLLFPHIKKENSLILFPMVMASSGENGGLFPTSFLAVIRKW